MSAGRLVLVTGASAGIGRAACLAFLAGGDRVLAVARRRDRLDQLAADAGRDGSRLKPLVADVADGASMASLASAVLAEDGTPDVLVANAGVGLDARFVDTTDEAFRAILETNVLGVVRTIRPFVSRMVARGSGRILIVSSVVGKRGIPHYAAYSASKFALHGMADALRGEIAGSGVSVGLICPSSTTTEFQDNLRRIGPAQKRLRPRRHTAESVAGAIVRMSRSRSRETVLSAEGKLMVVVNAVAPWLLDRILSRALVERES